ncbi:MAG TPA: hypothetical protein VIR78_12945 [Malonomonas sp.]
MKIPSAYISTRTGNIPPEAVSITATAGRPKLQAATDSYNRNSQPATAQVIDAEYVEFYTPSQQVLNQERHTLDNTLAGEPTTSATMETGSPLTSVANKYQLSAKNTPLPGSLLNIYA